MMTKPEEEDEVATMSKAMESNNFISTRLKSDKSCALSHCLSLSQRAACSASIAVATENVSTRLKEGNKKHNHNSPLYSNKSGNRSDIHLNHEQIIILAHKI